MLRSILFVVAVYYKCFPKLCRLATCGPKRHMWSEFQRPCRLLFFVSKVFSGYGQVIFHLKLRQGDKTLRWRAQGGQWICGRRSSSGRQLSTGGSGVYAERGWAGGYRFYLCGSTFVEPFNGVIRVGPATAKSISHGSAVHFSNSDVTDAITMVLAGVSWPLETILCAHFVQPLVFVGLTLTAQRCKQKWPPAPLDKMCAFWMAVQSNFWSRSRSRQMHIRK